MAWEWVAPVVVATAYVNVLAVVHTNTDALGAVTTSRTGWEEEKLTVLREEFIAINAQMGIFGAQAVRDKFKAWAKRRAALMSSHIALREALEDAPKASMRACGRNVRRLAAGSRSRLQRFVKR